MKKFTLTLKWALCMMLLFVGTNAFAQYSGEVTQGPTTDYSQAQIKFKLTDVATTLGTDTATLAKALDDWATKAPTDDASKMFALIGKDGATQYNYTGNYGEFWMDEDGQVHAYDGAAWYVGNSWNVTKDEYVVYVGQMPNHFTASDTVSTKVALYYGGKQATFDVTLRVYVPTLPEVQPLISKLNIVGSQEITHEMYPRSDYDADAVKVSMKGVPELLGLSQSDFASLASSMAYQPKLDLTYGMMSDSIVKIKTNDGWVRRALDASGDTLAACGNAPYDKADVFYVQNPTYAAADTTLAVNIGQYPGSLKVGNKVYSDVYLVYGDKAYRVRYNINIIEAPYHGLDDMTAVGDTLIELSQVPTTDYSTVKFTLNTNTIAAALGTTASGLSLQAIDANGSLSSNATANNGGYWLTKNGTIVSYGASAAFFIEPDAANNYSAMHAGQYPNALAAGDTARTVLYLVKDSSKYYSVHVNFYIIKGSEVDQNKFESVATRNLIIQQLLDNSYNFSDANNTGTTASVNISEVNDLIGTTEPVLYALEQDSLVATGKPVYTKSYTCTPNPGFWVTADGHRGTWGAKSCVWGIVYASDGTKGTFRCIQFPGNTKVGDSYNGQYFLVNEETGKMLTVNVNFQIVQTLAQISEVGNMSVKLPVSFEDATVKVGLKTVANALGYGSVDELLTSGTFRGLKQDGTYTDAVDPVGNGITFDNNGYAQTEGGNIGINFAADGDSADIITYCNAEIAETFNIPATVCFDKTGTDGAVKRYVISLTFMDPAAYQAIITGIDTIKAETIANGKIYDLNGRRVIRPVKGVYIMNGKKFVVK